MFMYNEYSNQQSMNYDVFITVKMSAKLSQWFVTSDLKRELMEKMWHPKNMEKWKGWGHCDDDDDDNECECAYEIV
jgi:hypothetical protein